MKSKNNEMKSGSSGKDVNTIKGGKAKEKHVGLFKQMKSKEMHKEPSGVGKMNEPEGFGHAGYSMKGPMMEYGQGAKMSGGSNNHDLKEGYLSAHKPETNEVGKGEME